MATAANAKQFGGKGDLITPKWQSAANVLAANYLNTLVKEYLENTLQISFHNMQSGIGSVGYHVAEKVTVELKREEVVKKRQMPKPQNASILLQLW